MTITLAPWLCTLIIPIVSCSCPIKEFNNFLLRVCTDRSEVSTAITFQCPLSDHNYTTVGYFNPMSKTAVITVDRLCPDPEANYQACGLNRFNRGTSKYFRNENVKELSDLRNEDPFAVVSVPTKVGNLNTTWRPSAVLYRQQT